MNGRTIAITGASDGIGAALAVALARPTVNLALAARSEDKLRGVARRCEDAGARVEAVCADVAEPTDCQKFIERTVACFSRLDVLVNNAGISMLCPFDQVTDLSLFERLMKVNYLGAVHCTHHALPHLKGTHGLIVAVSSLQGKTGFPLYTGYSASKHAMQGFFDSLRIELRPTGVDVLVVSPGPVATNIHTSRISGDGKSQPVAAQPNRGEMPVDQCVQQIVRAMEHRQRELVMTPSGKLIGWLRLVSPSLVDRLVDRAVRKFHGA
jgi:short-subunit dehydrogenase